MARIAHLNIRLYFPESSQHKEFKRFYFVKMTSTIPYPADTCYWNDVGQTSMRCHHVASTSVRRHVPAEIC